MVESQLLGGCSQCLGLLLTASLSLPRMLFVTVVPSRSPPASSGHPATPSDILLPSADCTLQSRAGAGRRGQPHSESQGI